VARCVADYAIVNRAAQSSNERQRSECPSGSERGAGACEPPEPAGSGQSILVEAGATLPEQEARD
jgi:hypothetical protein